VVQQALYL